MAENSKFLENVQKFYITYSKDAISETVFRKFEYRKDS